MRLGDLVQSRRLPLFDALADRDVRTDADGGGGRFAKDEHATMPRSAAGVGLEAGDILVQLSSRYGSSERVVLWSDDERRYWLRRGALRLRPLRDVVEPEYLAWCLRRVLEERVFPRSGDLDRIDHTWFLDTRIALPASADQLRVLRLLNGVIEARGMRDAAEATRARMLPATYRRLLRAKDAGNLVHRPLHELVVLVLGDAAGYWQGVMSDSLGRSTVIERADGQPMLITIGRAGYQCGRVSLVPAATRITESTWFVGSVSSQIHPRYLAAALQHADLRRYATGSTRRQLGWRDIQDVRIPVPDAEAQAGFVAKAERLDLLDEQAGIGAERLDQLWERINRRAFDEPPSAGRSASGPDAHSK